MSPFSRLLLILGTLFVVAVGVAFFYSKDLIKNNPFLDKHLLKR